MGAISEDMLNRKFTYRQRYLFFALIFFLAVLPPLYFALHTANFLIQSKEVQKLGIRYQRALSTLLDALLRYQNTPEPSANLKQTLDQEILHELETLQGEELQSQDLFPKRFGKGFSNAWHSDINTIGWFKRWNNVIHEGSRSPSLEPLIASIKNALQRTGEDLLLFNNANPLIEALAAPPLEKLNEALNSSILTLRWLKGLLIALFSLAAFFIIVYILSRALTRHFQILVNHISGGAIQVPTKDEFGEVASLLDKVRESTAKAVTKLHSFNKKGSEAQKNLVQAIQEEDEILSRQDKMAGDLEKVAQGVVRKSQQLATLMTSLDSNEEADASLQQLQNNMSQLVYEAADLVLLMKSVEEKIADMNRHIAFMTKVSERASLLSLNASIETSAVTKQQESFASIAQKIRRFALHTDQSTQEIRTIFQTMSDDVSEAKSETVSCLQQIQTSVEQLLPFHNHLKRITDRALILKNKYEGFSRLMQEQVSQSEQLLQTIASLHKAVQDNRQLKETLHTSSSDLEAIMRALRKILKRAKT